MPVCLHCGTLAPEAALFCPKCGFTLPQEGVPAVSPAGGGPAPFGRATGPAGGGGAAAGTPLSGAPAPPTPPPPAPPPTDPRGSAAVPPSPPPAPFAGTMPPGGKYCVRCGTLISRVAVYCPVCQQPQGP